VRKTRGEWVIVPSWIEEHSAGMDQVVKTSKRRELGFIGSGSGAGGSDLRREEIGGSRKTGSGDRG